MRKFEILQAKPANYTELLDVWEASVRATHHFLNEADIQHYKPLVLQEYFDQLTLYCMRNEERIIGFAGINGDLLQMLFVHPDGIGKGIGKALVNYVINSHGVDKVDVNEQNIQAVGFYEHMGFEVTERFDHDSSGKPFPILAMVLKSWG